FVDLAVGLRLGQQLKSLISDRGFDLLHTHAPLVPTLPLMAIRAASCPQVGTFHTTAGRSRMLEWARSYLAPTVEKLDARIAVSSTARDFVAHYFPGDYEVIPNGVDLSRFRPDVPPFLEHRREGVVNLLFVGRLDPRKGADRLIAAMPRIVERTEGRVQ